ncbi:Glycosyl transferase OS=Bosea thiooxidans OX=53254 GN=ARD30_09690 PE=3 SV=1 [Bosea thiooxidans]
MTPGRARALRLTLVAEFPANFFKAYIGRRHALRGAYGFMTAMNYAFYRYLRVAKHWERRLQRRAAQPDDATAARPGASDG